MIGFKELKQKLLKNKLVCKNCLNTFSYPYDYRHGNHICIASTPRFRSHKDARAHGCSIVKASTYFKIIYGDD